MLLLFEELHQGRVEPVLIGFYEGVEGFVCLMGEFVDVGDGFFEGLDLLILDVAFYFLELVQGFEDGFEFAAFSFAGDLFGDFPDVLFGGEVFFSFAGDEDAFDKAPVDEFTDVHVGVAPGDVEFCHDLVCAEGVGHDH